MKKQLVIGSLLVSGACALSAQNESVHFTEYDLSNGLHVILYPNQTTPNVLVSLMYHVGAKNENPSKTGFAHFFEHLMFEGSENIERGQYFEMIQGAGGSLNANTTQDRTYYFEYLPSNELELALWMESERMLHAKIDSVGVATQKGVVIEERKQSYDNRPYGTFMEELGKRAFTKHPYRWQTIGDPEHIRQATFDDINTFYKTYYVPNNAVLVIAGDFDEAQTKEWVDKYFGEIPRGKIPMYRPEIVEPIQTVEVRDTVYDNIQLPAVFMSYHAPAMGTKESYAMDVLCQILYGGKSSRLKTQLDDKGLTAQTLLYYGANEDPGLVYVVGIANLGIEPELLEEVINQELEKVRTELVSPEEFQMALAAKEFEVASNLQSLSGVAQTLAGCYTYFKDTDQVNQELNNYEEITREDLLAVAQKYFQPQSRVVLYYRNKNEDNTSKEAVELAESQTLAAIKETIDSDPFISAFDRSIRPNSAPAKEINIQDAHEFVLSNGMKVFLVKDAATPIVYYNLMLDVKPELQGEKAGMYGLFSEVFGKATTSRNKENLNKEIDLIGARFSTNSRGASIRFLKKYEENALDILSDVLLNPVFSQEEFDLSMSTYKAYLASVEDDGGEINRRISQVLTYGRNFPAGEIETLQTLENIELADLQTFYDTYYAPNVSRLVIIGDVNEEDVKTKLEQHFGNWNEKSVPQTKYMEPLSLSSPRVAFSEKPGAVQSFIDVSYPFDFSVGYADYEAALLMNQILGNGSMSRLFKNLRETHSYTYGVYSRLEPHELMGRFYLVAGYTSPSVRADATADAIQEIIHEMDRIINDPVSEQELKNAKAYAAGNFSRSLENSSTIAEFALNIDKYNLPKDYYKNFLKRLDAVTVEDIQKVAQKYIHPEKAWIVVTGDKEHSEALKRFSGDGIVEFYDSNGLKICLQTP